MKLVVRVGEALARRTNRREATTRAAAAIFGLAAAWAMQGPLGSTALAQKCPNLSGFTECSPPTGRYCAALDPRFCDDQKCAGGCTLDPQFYPDDTQSGCWCTKTRQTKNKHKRSYYYRCCDCNCPGVGLCGCKKKVFVN